MQLLRSCTRTLARRWYTNELHKSHQLQQRLTLSTSISLKGRRSSTARNLSHHHYGVPPSRLDSKEHPLGWGTIQGRVEPYFAQHWKFPSEKARHSFFAVGFSQAFSQFSPLTLDERVEGTCKMHYLALLIDGELHKNHMRSGPC
jgi:aristolochene synthase